MSVGVAGFSPAKQLKSSLSPFHWHTTDVRQFCKTQEGGSALSQVSSFMRVPPGFVWNFSSSGTFNCMPYFDFRCPVSIVHICFSRTRQFPSSAWRNYNLRDQKQNFYSGPPGAPSHSGPIYKVPGPQSFASSAFPSCVTATSHTKSYFAIFDQHDVTNVR